MAKYRVTLRGAVVHVIEADRWTEFDYLISFFSRNGVNFDNVAAFTKTDIQSIVKV